MLFFIVFLFCSSGFGLHPKELAKQYEKARTLEVNPKLTKDQENQRVKSLEKHLQSPAFQKKVEAEQARIKQELFPSLSLKTEEEKASVLSKRDRGEAVYLFLSTSMPKETIRAYMQDIARYKSDQIKVVLKGLKNKDWKTTFMHIQEYLIEDERCTKKPCKAISGASIEIDPVIFKAFKVRLVPAVAYTSDKQKVRQGKTTLEDRIHYGDVQFSYHIKKLYEGIESPLLKELVGG